MEQKSEEIGANESAQLNPITNLDRTNCSELSLSEPTPNDVAGCSNTKEGNIDTCVAGCSNTKVDYKGKGILESSVEVDDSTRVISTVGEACDVLMYENPLQSQIHSLEPPDYGINIREWLDAKCFNASKNDKLHLFMKILQTVDIQHNQGMALVELQPSSFIYIFKTGEVKYIGSLMKTEFWSEHQDNTKKRCLEPELNTPEKMQKVDMDNVAMLETSFSGFIEGKTTNQIPLNDWLKVCKAVLERCWYAYPEGFEIEDLRPSNIYSLGILLFEFLCYSDRMDIHSCMMLGSRLSILPPHFIHENHLEAGICLMMLHPDASTRPTTSDLLQSYFIYEIESTHIRNNVVEDEVESEVLLDFLVSVEKSREERASTLLQSLELLDEDLEVIESKQACRKSLDTIGSCDDFNLKDQRGACSTSKENVLSDKILENISELENTYFSAKSSSKVEKMSNTDRVDEGILMKPERLYCAQDPPSLPTTEEDRLGMFFDGVCKFGCNKKLEECGTLKNSHFLKSKEVISSLSFDRDEKYIATVGISKKIKIFEFDSLLDDSVDVKYPVVEMSSRIKFICICWNKYISNYLASTEHGGLVQIWDTNTGQGVAEYNEHKRTTWSVDFSKIDPKKFATGGDDYTVRIWNINERNSTCTIPSRLNVCCVQFSSHSSHLVAFGTADSKVYCYDLRHTKIPWCTLTGHGSAVSHVKFLDSESIVSAATDSTLKLWDLKKTSLDGLSANACTLTFKGHTNLQNFVGIEVLDGYIACGSETNEVYVYYKSLPMPIASHKFRHVDPLSGIENTDDDDDYYVSSVCWRKKSQMLVGANSNSTLKIFRMV